VYALMMRCGCFRQSSSCVSSHLRNNDKVVFRIPHALERQCPSSTNPSKDKKRRQEDHDATQNKVSSFGQFHNSFHLTSAAHLPLSANAAGICHPLGNWGSKGARYPRSGPSPPAIRYAPKKAVARPSNCTPTSNGATSGRAQKQIPGGLPSH